MAKNKRILLIERHLLSNDSYNFLNALSLTLNCKAMAYMIDEVTFDELSILGQISRKTFEDAFGELNKATDMSIYISNHLSDNNIASEWNNYQSKFYFLRHRDKILGYIKLNVGTAQNEDFENALEIERVYIIQENQSSGMGKLLLDFAVEFARSLKKSIIWLGVWERNEGAIRFYERNGFVQFSSHTFMLGEDKQIDVLMKREL
jgi:ribosomal protein S18 acetylase RimI-like enzyme